MGEQSGEYWRDRFRQLEEAQHDTSVQTMQEIEQQFRRAEQALDAKINAWYQRFAANNGISMIEAKRLLNSDELEEFHWNVDDYIKYGRENAIDQRWIKQLENASTKVHISRLEALKVQTQQEMEKLFGNYSDAVDRHIADIYSSGYYHTAFEVQRGISVGWDVQKLNQEKVSDIIHKPWAADGRNFSERIWTSKTQLINNLHDSLTRMCITGESPDKVIRELSQKMKVSRSQAANIIQTESAAFSAKAQESCYADLDVEEFEVIETLDDTTCSMCADMDGKHFSTEDYRIGVTVPPFHPRCRGCTCPYFDDEFANGERIARGADGKQYYVSEKMAYKEWKNSFVDGSKDGLTPIIVDGTMTDADKKAVFDYMSAKSYIVNEKLRIGAELSDSEREFVNNLDAALDKMPTYEGNLQRSLYFYSDDDIMAFLEEHKNGNVVRYNEYISTTRGEVYNPDGQVQIYIQNAKKGRDISSLNEGENEVLYERNTSFKIINTIEHDGKYYILMEETDAE